MRKIENLTGRKYGRLRVVGFSHMDKRSKTYWHCLCDCGERRVVVSSSLKTGNTKACGCLSRELSGKRLADALYKHGECQTRLYKTYIRMKDRCSAFGKRRGKHYADKGVEVCSEWKKDFMNFREWALNNGYDDKLSIDRIDPFGNYEPDNCRWANSVTQGRNKRASTYIEYMGMTLHLKEWSEYFGLDYHTLYQRWRDRKDVATLFLSKTDYIKYYRYGESVSAPNGETLNGDSEVKAT